MAINYLSIYGESVFINSLNLNLISALQHSPSVATSVAVECVFSQGHLVSSICNHLSTQRTWAILCLGQLSCLGLIKDSDVNHVTQMPDVEGAGDDSDGDVTALRHVHTSERWSRAGLNTNTDKKILTN